MAGLVYIPGSLIHGNIRFPECHALSDNGIAKSGVDVFNPSFDDRGAWIAAYYLYEKVQYFDCRIIASAAVLLLSRS